MPAHRAPTAPRQHRSATSKTEPESLAMAKKKQDRTQRCFINVLVRTGTRRELTKLKSELDIPSQGEVIDYLVSRLRTDPGAAFLKDTAGRKSAVAPKAARTKSGPKLKSRSGELPPASPGPMPVPKGHHPKAHARTQALTKPGSKALPKRVAKALPKAAAKSLAKGLSAPLSRPGPKRSTARVPAA